LVAEGCDHCGELRGFLPRDQQSHQLYAVVDHDAGPISIEAGLGFGLTPGSDKLMAKLILSSDLNGDSGMFRR